MSYLHWQEKTITDFSEKNISELYNDGFVFTRLGKGIMQQTRSVRIDLKKFTASSENRRILKKTEGVELIHLQVPVKEYSFSIGKMGKDFYDTKYGPGIMSANKIKEMITNAEKSNFNTVLQFEDKKVILGYTICFSNKELLHYSYPFYNLEAAPKDMGLGMMTRAIEYAKNAGMKYVYLGSLQRPGDVYKLQFEGLEWFDGKVWSSDQEQIREILKTANRPT